MRKPPLMIRLEKNDALLVILSNSMSSWQSQQVHLQDQDVEKRPQVLVYIPGPFDPYRKAS